LKTLRTYLGRVIRDIGRKIEGNASLGENALARRVLDQKQRQCGSKIYSLHAPEVECIGKGKAHRPYEFGVKVSVANTPARAKGGQFVTHPKALTGSSSISLRIEFCHSAACERAMTATIAQPVAATRLTARRRRSLIRGSSMQAQRQPPNTRMPYPDARAHPETTP
jgi:hypothetical protein